MGIPAFYFDGKTSRRAGVSLTVHNGIAEVTGEVQRDCPIAELRVSERFRHAPRKVTFPDGAYLEILDNRAFDALLYATNHRDSFVVRMQQSWRGALLACVILAAILVLGFRYGLPAAADFIAKALPEKAVRLIGREALEFLDRHLLLPSRLDTQRQNEIVSRFRSMVPPSGNAPRYEIIFRKSRIGPNAFALPSGQIVLTDELVTLTGKDDALMGVLSHELGHLQERHLLRRILQASITAAVATLVLGDVSSVLANMPTYMLDLKYSRDAEREADDYATAMMKKNGISAEPFARLLEKLAEKPATPSPYLSSHPSAAERARRIRNAGKIINASAGTGAVRTAP